MGRFLITVSCLLFLLSACSQAGKFEGRVAQCPASIHGLRTETLMPRAATDVRYMLDYSDIGDVYIEWACHVDRSQVLAFAAERGYTFVNTMPTNAPHCFFKFYGSWDFPKDFLFSFKPGVSSSGLFLLYDGTTQTLYGNYTDR